MNLWLLYSILLQVNPLLYHFGYNFGQVFKDLSGSTSYAINGDTTSSEVSDTKPTDRGAYFSGTTYIKCPPNSETTSTISLSSPFTFVVWTISDTSEGVVWIHEKDANNYFVIYRDAGKKVAYRLKTGSSDSTLRVMATDSFKEKIWKLLYVSYSHPSLSVYVSPGYSDSVSMTSTYSESGSYTSYLGKSWSSFTGYKGFIYYCQITNTALNYQSFIGSSSTNCLVANCASCTESIKDPYFGTQGCLSKEINDDKNSASQGCGAICSGLSVSCDSQKTCMSCGCSFGSCVNIASSMVCLCPTIATPTASSCSCPNRYYYQSEQCLPCLASCKTCVDATSCSSCIALNSYITASNLCECNIKYYTSNVNMDTTDSCKACNSECSKCVEANKCTECQALNASPNVTSGCYCHDKFYGSNLISTSSCLACHSDCQTCSQANLCLTCIVTNKVPSTTAGCQCDQYYYLDSGTCLPCNSDCATCNDPNICILCKDPNAEPDTSGCKCKTGYGINPDGNCWICSDECTSCDANYICQGCKDLNADPNSVYTCTCKDGYYKSGLNCFTCDSRCETCSSLTTCTSCQDPSAVIIDGMCTCPDGKYNSVSDCTTCDPQCLDCQETCGTCRSDTQCRTCWDPNAEKLKTGFCACKSSFYLNSTSKTCISCDNTCKTCSGPSEFDCLSCKYVQFFNSCLLECPISYMLLDDLCIPTESNDTIMEFKFLDVGTFYKDFVHGYIAEQYSLTDPIDLNGVVNVLQRGVYFDGSNMLRVNISGVLLLGSTYCVTLWFKTADDGFLFYKESKIEILVELGKIKGNFLVNGEMTQSLASEKVADKWMHVYVSIEYSTGSMVKVVKDKVTLYSQKVSDFYYIDDFDEFVFIGGSPGKNLTFKGYMYDFKIFSKAVPVESLVVECTGCSVCAVGNQCLSECKSNEYISSSGACSPCPSKCPNSCKNSRQCNTCDDPVCVGCNSTQPKSCYLCKSGYEVIKGSCRICSSSTFYNLATKSCDKCPDLCRTCKSLKQCLTCKPNSQLKNSTCDCIQGYKFNLNCTRILFSASLSVNSKNLCTLSFNESLNSSLSTSDIILKLNNESPSYKFKEISKSEYQITPQITSLKSGSTIIVEFISIIESSENSLLETKYLEGNLTKTQQMIEQEELDEKADKSKSLAKNISIVLACLLSFFGVSFSNLFGIFEFFNSVEMIYTVYLFDNELNPVLSEFLIGIKVIDFIPTPLSLLISEDVGGKTSEKMKNFGFRTSLAFVYLDAHIMGFFLTSIAMIVLSLISSSCKLKLQKKLKFGFYLRFWLQSYFELMVASTFGLVFSDKSEDIDKFDYFFCIMILIIQVLMTLFFIYLLHKRGLLQNEDQSSEFLFKYSTFFDLLNDTGIGNRLFYLIFILRRVILIAIIHTIKICEFQLTVHIIMSITVIFKQISIYVGFSRCFKHNYMNIFHIINELNIAAYTCVVFSSQVSGRIMDSLDGSYTCIYLIFVSWGLIIMASLYEPLNINCLKVRNYFKHAKLKKVSQKYRNQTSPEIESDASKKY